MACRICELIRATKNKVYEDDVVVALLHDRPASVGHMLVIPKEHAAILEQVPDQTAARMFQVANRLSSVAFDALGAMGTNILLNNGIGAGQDENHCVLHVIPRRENDNLNLQWQPHQMSDDDLSTAELQIADASKPDRPQIVEETNQPQVAEDYLLKSLRRIP
jgi:histidine triad (HIT) family protein